MQTVIFDMDGVLINSERMHYEALSKTLAARGAVLGWEYYAQFVGSSAAHMWEVLERDFGLSDSRKERAAAYAMNQWFFLERDGYIAVPGAQKLVEQLFCAGARLAVASSSALPAIEATVEALQIRHCFVRLISGESVARPKPAPDVFLEAARQLQTPPEDCIVIEDSENGVRAAKAAGMYCIGLQNPDSGAQNLSAADRIVDTLEGLRL